MGAGDQSMQRVLDNLWTRVGRIEAHLGLTAVADADPAVATAHIELEEWRAAPVRPRPPNYRHPWTKG